MTLRLTPQAVIAAYDYLKITAPFNKLKLPDADDLEFRVTRHKDRFGHFDDRDGKQPWKNIAISQVHVKTTASLIEVLAHELVHVALYVAGNPNWDDHGKAFKALAARVCRAHGFNLLIF